MRCKMKKYISAILIPCLLLQFCGCYSNREITIEELKNYKGERDIKIITDIDTILINRDSTEIIKYESYKKPVGFTKSGFILIGSGIVVILFSRIYSISEGIGFERIRYGRFIFGVFFIIVGIFFLIVGITQKDK